MKPKLFLTRRLPQPAMDKLSESFDMEVNWETRVMDSAEIIARATGKQALLTLLTDRIDRSVIESLPELKVISNYAVGYDNIDVQAASRHNIPVGITPGVLSETTADLAFALILGIARRVVEADKFVREGRFMTWDPLLFLGRDVYGSTLGIIGMGRIGQAVARRALGFGMKVLYTKRTPLSAEKQMQGCYPADMDTLLKESDFVSLHLPMSPEVKHLLGKNELKIMKPSAYIINTARGSLIDEKELEKALRSGEIAGAALDVFELEPRITPGLLELDNVIALPHIGSATRETRTKMGILAAENAIAVLNGQQPHALANPEIYCPS